MNYDFIIIGSGASGGVAAKELSKIGFKVLIIEEGNWFVRKDFRTDVFNTIEKAFRNYGSQFAKGSGLISLLQGSCVGGSTVINGGICHELPSEVYQKWLSDWGNNSPISQQFSLEKIREIESQLSKELGIGVTIPKVEKFPVAKALQEEGWKYSPMLRNAPGCQGSGNCLQGCQTGAKKSIETTYIPEAIKLGAEIIVNHKAMKVADNYVLAKCLKTGVKKTFFSKKGVILAAGVIHTPFLLKRSGFKHPSIGKNFSCHISLGVLAEYKKPVTEIEGQTQGIEVFSKELAPIKLATQLLPPELLFSRVNLLNSKITNSMKRWKYFSSWTASIPSAATGEITSGFLNPKIKFNPTKQDMILIRRGVAALSKIQFKMGAIKVFPGIYGALPEYTSAISEETLPLDSSRYFLGAGHLFGTCQLGSDPETSPLDENFKLRGSQSVYVMDASVFPTNIGVNPQLPIMAIARLASQVIAKRFS